jgi:putative membrane protein
MRKILIALLVFYALLVVYADVSILTGHMPPGIITPISTLVGFAFALLHAAQRMNWKKTLGLFACVFLISLAFESVGVATGLVYGPYHYTLKLGPLFLGLVPYQIPVAWFMMMYPSFVIADRLTPRALSAWMRLVGLAAIGGVIMTAWDVVMDPLMVRGGHWIWDVQGAFFGVPLQNYWGWWLTVFVTFGVFQLILRKTEQAENHALDRMVIILYALTGASQIIVGLFTGLAGPALAGLFAMLPWVWMGWFNNKE